LRDDAGVSMTMTWPELRSDFDTTAKRFATLIAGSDVDRPVKGSDWTVGDTAAHVTTAIERWMAMVDGPVSHIGRGHEFASYAAEINRREVNAQSKADSATRGAELLAATTRWLEVADTTESLHPYGIADAECSLGEATGVLLGELLIHGLDVARTLGSPWPINNDQAIAVTEGLLPMLPLLYDGTAAGGQSFTIDVRLRGRSRGLGLRCDPDTATISDGSPSNAAVHISANPVAWLLIGYGRRSQWWGAATGKVVAWGRKPWLAFRVGRLVVAP
jgi:uncharacterized protein (TIGR03083 family)